MRGSFRGMSERTGWDGSRPYFRYRQVQIAMSGADEVDDLAAAQARLRELQGHNSMNDKQTIQLSAHWWHG